MYDEEMDGMQPFTKDELRDIIHNLRQTLGEYEKMETAAAVEEEKKRKEGLVADRLDKQVSVNFPLWVYEKLKEEFVPLIKEKVELKRSDFCVSHALRYLGYFALKYPGLIRAVSLAELKDLYREDPS